MPAHPTPRFTLTWPAAPGYPLVDFLGPDTLLWARPQAAGGAVLVEVQLSTGEARPWPRRRLGEPSRLARSPEGGRVALAVGEAIELLSTGAQEPDAVLEATPHGAHLWGLDWPHPRRLVSQATRGPLRLWDVEARRVLAEADPAVARGWSLVGERWLLLGRPRTEGTRWWAPVWDGCSGAPVWELEHTLPAGARLSASRAALIPGTADGVAVLTEDDGAEARSVVCVLSERGARVLGEVRGPSGGVSPPASELELIGDRWVVVGGRGFKGAWDLRTGQASACPAVCSAAPVGRVLGEDGLVVDLRSGAQRQLRPGLDGLSAGDRCAAWSPDGERLALALGDTLEVYAGLGLGD